jgi:hypothetical protein
MEPNLSDEERAVYEEEKRRIDEDARIANKRLNYALAKDMAIATGKKVPANPFYPDGGEVPFIKRIMTPAGRSPQRY